MNLIIQAAETCHLPDIAAVYQTCFGREKYHAQWINANFQALPRMRYYVAIVDDHVVGYALWSVKNGFRDRSIVELEQVAVMSACRGTGIGKQLLERSFDQFGSSLKAMDLEIKAIYLTTRDGNEAEGLYRKVFGVERQGVISNYGSGDELILYRRCPDA